MQQSSTYTLKGTSIWLICAVFFLYEFLLRTVVGTFQHPIMYDFDISPIEFSLLSSTAYHSIYAVMQIPVGIIVDRIGLKKSLLVGCLVCAASSIGFAYSYGYIPAIAFRFLTGFGSSFGFICLLVSVYDWLPKKHVALLIGVSQFIGTMGPMLAAGPLEVIAEQGDIKWRVIFTFLGIFGLFLSSLIFIFVENSQEKSGSYTILKRPEGILKICKRLLMNQQAWSIGIFSGLVYFSLEYLSENDGKVFLMEKGFTGTYAAFMITLSWLGYAIGCPTLGWVSDYFKRRKSPMIFSALFCTGGITGIIYIENQIVVAVSFLFLGLGAAGQSVGFAMMSEQFKKPYLAAGLSLNNATITFFSAINAPILGGFLETLKSDRMPNYLDYQNVFFFLAAAVSLSIIISIFLLRETYCKSKVDFTILERPGAK